MISLLCFHLPENGHERVWDWRLEHIPVGLGEGPRNHEGGDIRMKVVDMGQAHVA
jgi:hypothetical protein